MNGEASEAGVCRTVGCGKPATLRCPTCKELDIAGQSFCSQDCFKGSWDTHKSLHKAAKAAREQLLAQVTAAMTTKVRRPDGFDGFRFSGKLRPGIVSPRATVPAGIRKPDYADSGVPHSELIADRESTGIPVLNPAAREHMRKACRLAREVLDVAAAAVRPGITGDELDRIVFAATIARNCYPSPLNYHGFPKSVCVSVNEVICHGIPDSRPLEEGDIVNLDVSLFSEEGYHADLNETYAVGAVPDVALNVMRCSYECLAAAVAICRPGAMYRDVGTVVSRVAGTYGFSVVKSYCGHGVGKLFHCTPTIPHYANNKAKGIMRAGHVFTIEPMINEGSAGDEMWPDKWTAVTRDGKRSAQFEHTLLITDDGVEILTARAGADRSTMVWSDDAVRRPLHAASAAMPTSSA